MFKPFLVLSLGLSLFFVSCSARMTGVIHESGAADISIRASLEPKTAALLKSFSQSPGDFSIDGAAIGKSMAAAPGISSALLQNMDPTTIDGPVKISKIDDFLVTGTSKNDVYRLARYTQNSGGGSLTINLDLSKGPELIGLFSSDVADYLDAIMAPVATGEVLTVKEYLDLVTSVYGGNISNEIKNAMVTISLTMPGTVKSVKGGGFVKNQANFSVPLTDLLVLEKPVVYEIIWTK